MGTVGLPKPDPESFPVHQAIQAVLVVCRRCEGQHNVRIRIRREIAGIIDGVSLSHFLPGLCYDVSDSLGGYLISSGDADEVSASTPVAEPTDDSTGSAAFGGVVVASQVDRAADRPRPKRTRRKVG